MKKYIGLVLSAFFALEGISVCFAMEDGPQESIKIAHARALKRRSHEMNEEMLKNLREHPEKRITLDFKKSSSLEKPHHSRLFLRLSQMSSARSLQEAPVGQNTEKVEKSLERLDIAKDNFSPK